MVNKQLSVLHSDECRRLLDNVTVGRLAVVIAGAPVVYPMNFHLDGTEIVLRSDPGSKLEWGLRGPVCFEVDQLDPVTETGWSVIVQGRLEEVTRYDAPSRQAHVHSLPVRPWATGDKAHWIRLIPESITGRRIS